MRSKALCKLGDALSGSFGGVAHLLDDGEYGSVALAFAGWHRLLLRQHHGSFTVSFPTGPSWRIHTADELRREEAAVATPPVVSLADALVAALPICGAASTVGFPGTPVPAEAWLKKGDVSVGFFQESAAVRIVVWAEKALSKTVKKPPAAESLASFLQKALAAQAKSVAAGRAAAARTALLPLPDIVDVVALLQRGVRITTSGGRYHETFFWEGGLKREIFDEGLSAIAPCTQDDLLEDVRLYPDVFRAALAGDRR